MDTSIERCCSRYFGGSAHTLPALRLLAHANSTHLQVFTSEGFCLTPEWERQKWRKALIPGSSPQSITVGSQRQNNPYALLLSRERCVYTVSQNAPAGSSVHCPQLLPALSCAIYQLPALPCHFSYACFQGSPPKQDPCLRIGFWGNTN